MMFGTTPARRFDWKREAPPVIAVAGLIADYVSPPALWTIWLPLTAVIMLLALRKRLAAALVFLLSSWVLIPLAAQTVLAVENMRGKHQFLLVDTAPVGSCWGAVHFPARIGNIDVTVMPIGPRHLINPRGPMLRAVETFANVHNALVVDRLEWNAARELPQLEPDDTVK
jgi:hypothetical protein